MIFSTWHTVDVLPGNELVTIVTCFVSFVINSVFPLVFDNEFIPQALPAEKWRHEEASTMMLETLIDQANINVTKQERQFLVNKTKKRTIQKEIAP